MKCRKKITAAEKRLIRNALEYKRGKVIWKYRDDVHKTFNTKHAGKVAGSINKYGYIKISLNGRHYLAHRIAWFLKTGSWPTLLVIHRNRDRADNRWNNLKQVPPRDCFKIAEYEGNTSDVRGVCWDLTTEKWRAYIYHNCRQISLGRYVEMKDAVKARKAAEKKYKPWS